MGRTKEEKLADYVLEGAVPKVKAYLRKHRRLDVNKSADHKQRTLLHLVCANGDDAIARVLLKYGADPALQDCNGDTAIHVALQKVLHGYKHVFNDLVIPLLKHSPRGSLDMANKKGRTARQLLEESDHKLKQEEEAEIEKERQRKAGELEDESWQKKLFDEWQGGSADQDEYFPFWQGYDESQFESYDSWAERMSHEHKQKRNPGQLPSAKHKKNKDDTKSKHKHTGDTNDKFAWERSHKKHEKKCHKSERLKKKLIDQKMDYLLRCKKVFDTSADSKLYYEDIPWPNNSNNVESMIQVLICDVDRSNKDDFKKLLRTQRLVWHPDKFIQKLGQRLMADDRERILERVTQLSQALNIIVAQEET